MGGSRGTAPRWIVAALVLLGPALPCAGEDPPTGEAPRLDDDSWRLEAEDLARRAQEAASRQDHEAALTLRRAAVTLLREKRPESRELATAQNDAAASFLDLGRAVEALPLLEDSLATTRRLFTGDHPDVAPGLNNLAATLLALGRAAEALPVFEEALAMKRRLFPGDHPEVAVGMSNLAATRRALGRAAEALPLDVESLAMRRRLFPGDHPSVASGLNNLAATLNELGRATEALPVLEEALAMRRRLFPGDHPEVARGVNDLAVTLDALGRAAEALPVFEEALAMRRRLFPGDHPEVAVGMSNLAATRRALGRAAEALPLDVESLAMRRRLFPGDHPDVASGLNNLAATLNELGRATEALPVFEEALAMRRRLFPGDHPSVASCLNNVAHMLEALGRATDALPLYEQALSMRRRLSPGDHPDVAQVLNNLAATLDALGRSAEALPLYEEALATMRRIFPGDHPDVALGINDLAATLGALGRTAEALPLAEEALAMRRGLFLDDHPDLAQGLNNLAATLKALGRTAEALPLYEQAFEMAVRLGSPDRWRWGTNLGRRHLAQGHAAEAVGPLRGAVEALEAIRTDARGLRTEERAQFVGSMRDWGDPYPLLVVAHEALGDQAAAFEALERGRGREMLDVLLRGQVDPVEQARASAHGDAARRAAIDEAVTRRVAAEAEVPRREREVEHARARPGVRRDELRALAEEESKARRALLEALSGVQRIVRDEVPGARPLTTREVQSLLRPGERLLAYSLSPEGSFAFVVGPDSIEVFEIATKTLEEAVDDCLDSLSHDANALTAEALATSRALFATLAPPPVWEAVRTAKRLYLMPDGPMSRVPFEALVVGEREGRPVFWVEAGPPIAYEPSGSVLAWLLERPRGAGERAEVVAVGDPVFAGSAAPVAWPKAGVLVTEVRGGGQAERLGLRPGDVIVGYDAKEVADRAALGAAVKAAGEGRTDIALVIVRDGERKELRVASGVLGVSIAGETPDVAGPKLLAGGPLAVALRSAAERGKRLRPLPGSRREVEALAEAFRAALGERARVTTLLGKEAREGALFEATRNPRVLHLATHGLADETETASFSALALTMPAIPVAGDDGFLTLVDLFGPWRGRLEGTDLVVLSACESTKGRMQRAEAMYALPWGFLYAGARAVVGSLWKVNDESTAFLMAEFYRSLLEKDGQDPLGALTAARLATKAKFPHPHHWAAFVFTGAPR